MKVCRFEKRVFVCRILLSAFLLFLLIFTSSVQAAGPCQLDLEGDLDLDCEVDINDLVLLASVWLTDRTGEPGAFLPDGIFVAIPSMGGSDFSGCGTITEPCATIGFGISQAVSNGHSYVFVSDGVYSETVTVSEGVTLWGGFDPVTWLRNDPEISHTIVMGGGSPHAKTLIVDTVTLSTEVSGFVFKGGEATQAGGNSYAVWIKDCDSTFLLEDNQIFAGRGGDGINGSDGQDGPDGVNGTGSSGIPDPDYDAFETTSSPCSSMNNRQFSNGGVFVHLGDDISGGNGGGNTCPPSWGTQQSGADGWPGQDGAGSPGGTGGDAGYDGAIAGGICSMPGPPIIGFDGNPGTAGLNGSGGTGGGDDQGSVTGYEWIGASGSPGTIGGNGSGGGGGGAGGGAEGSPPYDDRLGAHGGGGGSGGAGGEGGSGGGSGGGSFGIFIVNSSPVNGSVIIDNIIYAGRGGDGGDGGFGGAGGTGGSGGSGGNCPGSCFCYGSAGDGGHGGSGGHGGGGGGGSGGVSYGVYTWNVTGTLNYHNQNVLLGIPIGGAGGRGGKSIGDNGTAGAAGDEANYKYN